MGNSAVEVFREKFMSLAGGFHRAATVIEAMRAIASILAEHDARVVAVANLPRELHEQIAAYCADRGIELLAPPFARESLPHAIDQCQVGISGASFAIAETGTLVEITTDDSIRLVSTLPRVHVSVVEAATCLPTLLESGARLRAAFDATNGAIVATFLSGPSRTGDIEMRLTLGVHGPAVAHAIVLGSL